MSKRKKEQQTARQAGLDSTIASPFQGVRVTIGLPLPNNKEYSVDVSVPTRTALNQMYEFSKSLGMELRELPVHGLNVAENHNKMANQMWGEWLLIVGSDHDFGYNALAMLLDACMKPPYPRIIAGIMPRRMPPYNYVLMTIGEYRQMPAPIVPMLDYHPGQQMAGQVIDAGQDGHPIVVGSGFTLYHRSVFDTCKYPWFMYSCRESPEPMIEEALYHWDENISFSTYLEKLARGETDIDAGKLNEKATELRRLLGQSRACVGWGPDYGMCMKALDYGIKSYAHFGVPVRHYDMFAIHPGMFLRHIRESMGNWWTEAIRRAPSLTSQNLRRIAEAREEYMRAKDMSGKELEKEVGDASGVRGDAGQVHSQGNESEGGGEESREDLEQPAPGESGGAKTQEQVEA